jgi:hypothetical protein
MASAFSHAVAALSIGTCFYRPEISKRIWLAGVVCSVIPDLDVIVSDSAFTMVTSGDIADSRILWSSPLFWQPWLQLSCSGAEYPGSGDWGYLRICF